MWRLPAGLPAPTDEPVELAVARAQCSIDPVDATHDLLLIRYIRAARAHCERYCGVYFAPRSVTISCTSFGDFARMPYAPVTAVDSISYAALDGASVVLDQGAYRLEQGEDGLEPSIVLRAGQTWPQIAAGSEILVDLGVGNEPPDDVYLAMLLFIADSFLVRENGERADWTHLDAFLCNSRRGV